MKRKFILFMRILIITLIISLMYLSWNIWKTADPLQVEQGENNTATTSYNSESEGNSWKNIFSSDGENADESTQEKQTVSTADVSLDSPSSEKITKNLISGTKKVGDSLDGLAENAKDGSASLMEKTSTIMHMDEIIAEKKRMPGWTPLKDIPNSAIQSLLAIEDHGFYNHGALNFSSILRAAFINLQAGETRQGGSTLTQQMVKNLFLSNEKTFSRKMQEAILAILAEQRYSKDEILEMYFNTSYYGNGYYGIRAASAGYFGKKPQQLTIGESCLLAALPCAPSLLNPYKNPAGCAARIRLVLNNMEKYGHIGNDLKSQVIAKGIRLRNGYTIRLSQ